MLAGCGGASGSHRGRRLHAVMSRERPSAMESAPVSPALALPLMLLEPPYDRAVRVERLPASAADTPPGCLLAVRALEAAPAADLGSAIRPLRARCPWLPVIVSIRLPSAEATRAAAIAVRLGARGILFDGEPIYPTLLPLMTDPSTLAEDVLEWLQLCGLRMSPALQHAVREIFSSPVRHSRLERLFNAGSQSPRSVRARFRKRGLSSPRHWFAAARALRIALAVQGTRTPDLLRLALDLGFSDQSGLSQQVHRAFGLRPGNLRGTLGWEWLMARFLARELGATPHGLDRSGIPGPFRTSTAARRRASSPGGGDVGHRYT